MITETICDYDFAPNDIAQYVYVDKDNHEQTLMVRILGMLIATDEKFYMVHAHLNNLKEAELEPCECATNFYKNQLPPGHAVLCLDPDELLPNFRRIKLAVNNTKRKKR